MQAMNLKGKTALITGIGDNVGFAWHIAKALQAAGADLIFSPHPRVAGILNRFLTRERDADSRALPFGVTGELKAVAVIPCDVAYDNYDTIPEDMRSKKGYSDADVSIAGLAQSISDLGRKVDVVIHSIGFSPEIGNHHLNVSREGYLTSISISSYSLVAIARELQANFSSEGASIVALSYLAGERVMPYYGGGMASAKAALESDARNIAWFLGEQGHRVNVISAGPYASRAAKSIGDIQKMVDMTAEKSPLRRAITPEQVANTALFLASPLSAGITASTVYVDAGYHAMAI